MDVARKLMILAREMGLRLELADVAVESLVPAALAKASVDEFLKRLPEFDAPMAERVQQARTNGQVLRYVGATSTCAPARRPCGLQSFAPNHPFANISLTDNIVQFVTGALLRQSADRAGSGRRSGRDGGRHLRGSCCASAAC